MTVPLALDALMTPAGELTEIVIGMDNPAGIITPFGSVNWITDTRGETLEGTITPTGVLSGASFADGCFDTPYECLTSVTPDYDCVGACDTRIEIINPSINLSGMIVPIGQLTIPPTDTISLIGLSGIIAPQGFVQTPTPCADSVSLVADDPVARGALLTNYGFTVDSIQSWADWRLDNAIQYGILPTIPTIIPTYIRLWITGTGTAGQTSRIVITISGATPDTEYSISAVQAATAIGAIITYPAVADTFPGNMQQDFIRTSDEFGNLELGLEVTLSVTGFLLNYTIWWNFNIVAVPTTPCEE